nr:hypothetical protein GCM10020093_096900 [Planobispora longispora]
MAGERVASSSGAVDAGAVEAGAVDADGVVPAEAAVPLPLVAYSPIRAATTVAAAPIRAATTTGQFFPSFVPPLRAGPP